jgi:hypothetical protein
MLHLARLVFESWPNRNDGNLLSLDVNTIIQLIPNLGRRTTFTQKLARSGEALAKLDIRKRHTLLKQC